MSASRFNFAIDRGGTFTDVWARNPDGSEIVMKLLSVDPSHYADAPLEGIRRVISSFLPGVCPNPGDAIPSDLIASVRMGTTVATNALLEKEGEPFVFVTTKGFGDVLSIGNQARPDIFDLTVSVSAPIYSEVVEADERVVPCRPDCHLNRPEPVVTTASGQDIQVWRDLEEEKLRQDLVAVYKRGIRSVAVSLLHAHVYPAHEERIGAVARNIGFTHVSLSHQVIPAAKIVPRGFTTAVDAYLTPHIRKYIQTFQSGFSDCEALFHDDSSRFLFMQSDGGLVHVDHFIGSRAILSGPAGGVVGYSRSYERDPTESSSPAALIGFDMGGTSTDVSRFDPSFSSDGFDHVSETTLAGVHIQATQLNIVTVAAGGGSRLFFRTGRFVVGPESVGAHPGPVCYKKPGAHLAITDANLVLGRLLPEFFPSIFGPNQDERLDYASSKVAFQTFLDKEINPWQQAYHEQPYTIERAALGFVQVANEAMTRPIRSLTQARGFDSADHVLACFGAAGGQHACAVARGLGIRKVFIHKHAGILSAYGMALADVTHDVREPCSLMYSPKSFAQINSRLDALAAKAKGELQQRLSKGLSSNYVFECQLFLNMRYYGTDWALMVAGDASTSNGDTTPVHGDFKTAFVGRYLHEFGFKLADSRDILVDDVRVRVIAKTTIMEENVTGPKLSGDNTVSPGQTPPPIKTCGAWFENPDKPGEPMQFETRVFKYDELLSIPGGCLIDGPSILVTSNSTLVIEPECRARITRAGNVTIEIDYSRAPAGEIEVGCNASAPPDPVRLSVFEHRFMSIAEQMGDALRRTAISTNIKERLDFSCAIFGPNGGLVSNAPHIPVHLGSMQETVMCLISNFPLSRADQIGDISDDELCMLPGDVFLTNAPSVGGTHLPDLTVIAPVFGNSGQPLFFVAARGHHADIGGTAPGSMPPDSTFLWQEGAIFTRFKLVSKGVFREDALAAILSPPPEILAKIGPGSSASRSLADNFSDLRAQIASCTRGAALLKQLIAQKGLAVVQAYMSHIQGNAEAAVRQLLKDTARKFGGEEGCILYSQDSMDNGAEIKLKIEVNPTKGSAVFDFSGTSCQLRGNLNAPRAVAMSAIIYCLRAMLPHDIPLNQGCLTPVSVIIPPRSLLDPDHSAAVVAGNVLTSQRLCDVILTAFKATACSQGCMNNVTWGTSVAPSFGYYETVAGGCGAGPSWSGTSGKHSHMTNTRITDPEILETRYPVVLQRFSMRPRSGGRCRGNDLVSSFHGGDGVWRETLFRRPLTLSLLTERRVNSPAGLYGGRHGRRGINLLRCVDGGRVVRLDSRVILDVAPGDCLRLLTPGGGAYGHPCTAKHASVEMDENELVATMQHLHDEETKLFETEVAEWEML